MAREVTMISPKQNGEILSDNLDIPKSDKEDLVDDTFNIHFDQEIHELSNDFCKYYHASNIEDEGMFFAIVYEKSFVVNAKTISLLLKKPVDGINRIVSWSIVRISLDNTERLVVIVDGYNYNNNLLSYVEKNGLISLSSSEKIIAQLTKAIHELSMQGIYGYNICPSNILMSEEGAVLNLREFINSYPYFYEQEQYIAPEIIECLKVSRKTSTCKQDVYALGVTVFYSLSGSSPWTKFLQPEEYNEVRFENGSYKYLMSKQKIPERFRNFLRFTMHDSALIRWDIRKIYDWLEGRADKVIYDSLSDNKYTIGFNDKNYSNPKSLSYAMFRSWEKANKFIRDTKLLQWAGKQNLNSDALAAINSLLDMRYNDPSVNSGSTYSQKLCKLFSILDPSGALRYEMMSVSAESIPETLHYLQISKRKVLVEQLIKIMQDKGWKDYPNNNSAGYLGEDKGDKFHSLSNNINNSSLYNNNERLIYSLNPYLPCLSSVLDGKYVTDIKGLLMALDSYAEKKPNNFHLDRHVFAFVAAKLVLNDDIAPVILPSFPKFADHALVKNLSIINLLHQYEPEVSIVNLCKALGLELIKLSEEYLHNAEFKKNVSAKIETVAQEGNISNIIAIFSNQQEFINDHNGYYEACKKVGFLEEEILRLHTQTNTFNAEAILLGQKTTVFVSYILCLVAIVTIIM